MIVSHPRWLLLGLYLLSSGAVACGSPQSNPKAVEQSEDGRSKGFSKDDKARCEYVGRVDREVSEATAPNALTPNIRRVFQVVGQGGDRRLVLVCREVDTNLDGVKDVMRTFNDKGEAAREEADTNYDGQVDSWLSFAGGRIAKQVLDVNGDRKPDQWKFYNNGRLSRIHRDSNKDGEPDIWEIYVRGTLERIGVDLDFDGRVDRWDRDEQARLTTETREAESKGADSDAGAPASNDAGSAEPSSPSKDAGSGSDAATEASKPPKK